MRSVQLHAFFDELEKIAANFKFLSPMAQGHAQTIKALGGLKKARAAEVGAGVSKALKPVAP